MAELTDRIGQVSGGQADRVAQIGMANQPSGLDLINQLMQLNQEQATANERVANPATLHDEMRSAPGLAAILGSLVAGGIGATVGGDTGQQLLEAGSGLMEGYAGQRSQVVASSNEAAAAQKATLDEAINQQRNRLTMLLQAQPDLFIDAETGQPVVHPMMIGFASTGTFIPINPVSNHTLLNRAKIRQELIDFGRELVATGTTPELRRKGLRLIGEGTEVEFSEEFYGLVSSGNERDILMQLLRDDTYTETSLFQAQVAAQQSGKSLLEVAELFVKKPQALDGYKMTLADEQLQALREYSRRLEQNPHINDATLSMDEKLQFLFSEPKDAYYLTLLRDKYVEDVSPSAIMSMVASNTMLIRTINELPGGQGLLQKTAEKHGVDYTDADWQHQLSVKLAEAGLPAMQTIQRQQRVENTGVMAIEIRNSIRGVDFIENAKIPNYVLNNFTDWLVLSERSDMIRGADDGIGTGVYDVAELNRRVRENVSAMINSEAAFRSAFERYEKATGLKFLPTEEGAQ